MNKNFGIVYHKKKRKTNKLKNLKLYKACSTVEEAMHVIINDPTIEELGKKNNFYIIEIVED